VVTTRGHTVFMALFGTLGWAALLAVTYVPGFGPDSVRVPPALSFTLFFLTIVGVRGMAFRMLPETVVSLDSAFYIASVVCLGSATSGRLVALALTLDALLRLLRADAAGKNPQGTFLQNLTFVIYFGGFSGGLLMALGWLFGVDGRALLGMRELEPSVLGLVAVVGLTFLVIHYLVQAVRLKLGGHPFADTMRRMALPGILAEASLLPLAAVVVLIYHPDRPLGFVLLAATYLLINYFFNRLTRASASLHQRVGELETLNRTAHALGSTLQLHELIETLAKETTHAIGGAEHLALTRLEGDDVVIDSYDRERGDFERHRAGREGLSARVLESRQPLYVADLRRSELGPGDDSGIRSWLGIPIVIYDDVVGVLSVQSREKDAFSDDEKRLLEAIGAQAAVAIQNARLYELATVDGLTGLYVRRYFDSRLREELERCRRFGTACSLVLLDIDDFKKLNDTYGHPLGDRVLRELAQVVRRAMRGVDIAARYGGEEFAFILPRTSIVDAHAVAERIRQDVADARIPTPEGVILAITASLGVCCYPDSGAEDAAGMVHRADVALYRAKATGKNRVELFWSGDVVPMASKKRPATLS
jgi:diguanylate cyclase (GGDEF)-like protein